MPDSSSRHEAANGNGRKWYSTGRVVSVLFWIVFTGVVGWGTYVWARTEGAHTKADQALVENKVQDEQIKTIRADLTEIKNDQREILRRLPR